MGENNSTDDIRANVNTSPPKKKSKGPMIAILAIALAAVLGIGAYATGLIGRGAGSGNERVGEAMTSFFEGEDNDFVEDWLGQEELTKEMIKGYQLSGNLELVSLPALESMGMSLPKGIMLSFEAGSNSEAGTSRGKFGAGLMGTSLLHAEYYMDQSKMQVAVPALFKEIIAADFSGDLTEKIKNAPLFKDSVDEETEQALKALPQAMSESQEFSRTMTRLATGEIELSDYPAMETALKKFRDSWTVEEAEDKKMTWNGSEGTFDGFDVTVEKEHFITFLNDMKTFLTTDEKFREDFMDFFAGQFAAQEGITLDEAYKKLDEEMTKGISEIQAEETLTSWTFTVHMTGDNELVSFAAGIPAEGSSADILVERYGGDFPNQNMKAVVTVTGGDNPGQLEMASTGKTEGDIQSRAFTINSEEATENSVDITVDSTMDKSSGALSGKMTVTGEDGGMPMEFGMDYTGSVEDVVKGKSATYVLDSLKVHAEGELLAEIKGEMKYSTENVTVAPLEGTEMDIFTATEEDMMKIMEQIQENAGVLMQLLGFGMGF